MGGNEKADIGAKLATRPKQTPVKTLTTSDIKRDPRDLWRKVIVLIFLKLKLKSYYHIRVGRYGF